MQLSCEIEGHPLGGGMLKLEPGEAARLIVPSVGWLSEKPGSAISEAILELRKWRHYG
jgi:hypothetical protein